VSARPAAPQTRVAEAQPRAPEPAATVAAAAEPAAALEPDGGKVRISYKVRSGDTLSTIARTFKTTIGALQSWNDLQGSRIAAGHTLTIYTR